MPIGMFRFGFFVSWAAVLSVETRGRRRIRGRPSQDAGEAIFAQHARIGRDVRCIVVGIDVFPAEYDKNQYDGNLQEYNEAVEDGAAFRTPYQEGSSARR